MGRFNFGAWLVVGAVALAATQLPSWTPSSQASAQPSRATNAQAGPALYETTGTTSAYVDRGRVIESDMVRTGRSVRVKPITTPRTITLNFVLLVEDGQARRSVTPQEKGELQDAVKAVDDYYNGFSGGKIRVSFGRVLGWTSAKGCDSDLLDSGAFNDLTRKPNNHVVMVKQCATDSGAGMALRPGKRIWMQAYDKYDESGKPLALAADVLAHEFGHNLGAAHAQTESCLTLFFKMKCTGKALKDRVIDEYGDSFDLMGGSQPGRPIVGPMNPIMSSQIGLPYKTTVVNLRSLKAPTTVTIQPRTASPDAVRALRFSIGGTDVHLTLAPNGLLDSYGDGAQPESGLGLPTLLAHGKLGEGSVLLKVVHAAAGSGIVEGFSYRLDRGVVMRVDEVSERRAVITFTPPSQDAVSGQLVPSKQGLTARWSDVADETVTGFRIRLLGERPCDLDRYGFIDFPCVMGSTSREPIAAEVDVDKSTLQYEFSRLNAGQSYAVQVVPLKGAQEGTGFLSQPVRNTAGLPKLDLVASRSAITLRGTTPVADFASVDYQIDCTGGRWFGGFLGSSSFPISIPVPSSCSPKSALVTVSGYFEDGRLFELQPTRLRFS